MKKQQNSFDLFKFIFALAVVAIHAKPFADIGETANWYVSSTLFNIAVPFFFAVSGFLLFDRISEMQETEKSAYIKKYTTHIIKMYAVWCVLWIPWKLLGMLSNGGINVKNIAVYIKGILLIAGGDALWYLLALFFAVIIIRLLMKKLTIRQVLYVGLGFYIVGTLISSWYGFMPDFIKKIADVYYSIFGSNQNALMTGIVYIAVGGVCAANKEKSMEFYITGTAVGFTVMVIESVIIQKLNCNYNSVCQQISLPFTTYMLINAILSIKLENKDIWVKMRNYSTLIYLSHCYIIRTIKMVLGIVKISIPYTVLYIAVVVLALVFSKIVLYLSKEKNIKIFKLLY